MKAIQEKNKPLMALREVLVTLVVMMMITPLHAQVRIGQDAAPTQGAVLDLSSTSAGYIGGLKLPHVVITNLTVIPTGGATGFKEVPADKTTLAGTLVYNTTASTGIPVGIYFWDGAKWIKTKYEVKNGLSADAADPNIFKLGGALTEPTTISGLTATNKMAFTGTGVDAFKVDDTTLSVDATNHRVGIGTAAPSYRLDITDGGVSYAPKVAMRYQDGRQQLKAIMASDENGGAYWQKNSRNTEWYNTKWTAPHSYAPNDTVHVIVPNLPIFPGFRKGCLGYITFKLPSYTKTTTPVYVYMCATNMAQIIYQWNIQAKMPSPILGYSKVSGVETNLFEISGSIREDFFPMCTMYIVYTTADAITAGQELSFSAFPYLFVTWDF